jgi:uncharacterized nucleotidyltransferase DUF6036
MSFLIDQLKEVVGLLSADEVPYAICGGLALAVHGKPRATVDIDILIQEQDLEKVLSSGRRAGFNLPAGEMNFAGGKIKIRRLSKIVPEYANDVLTLDMLLVTPHLQEVWNTREKRSWDFGDVWVVSREGLIKLKRISGRPNDLRDIETLEAE